MTKKQFNDGPEPTDFGKNIICAICLFGMLIIGGFLIYNCLSDIPTTANASATSQNNQQNAVIFAITNKDVVKFIPGIMFFGALVSTIVISFSTKNKKDEL